MSEHETVAPTDDHAAQPALLAISNEMVRIYKEQFGRGPTKVRSDWAGSDVLICSLRETFTPAERKLAALGQYERLRELRTFVQYTAEQEFTGAVEELVGRKVIGFVSGIDAARDVAAEVFYFEPAA
jgi:uncharacterized protein YbcI